MGRAIVSVLVAAGGTAGGLWLQNRSVSDELLIVVFVGCYGAAALIAWWPRWCAAARAFVGKQGIVVPTRDQWNATRKQVITGHKYRSEVVELDGRDFVNCEFENVRFRFSGTAPFDLTGECKITMPQGGGFHLETDHPAIKTFNHFAEGMTKALGSIPGHRVVANPQMVDDRGGVIPVPPVQILWARKNNDPSS